MLRPRRVVAIAVLMLVTLSVLPVAAPASAADRTAAPAATVPTGRIATPEKWWGVAGAVLCGTGIRVIRYAPEIGMNPYVLAATIGGCVLAAMDCL